MPEFGYQSICATGERDVERSVVQCAGCHAMLTAVQIAEGGYRCPNCFSLVCVICGCTPLRGCLRRCHWIAPGICSTHEHELELAVEEVFGLSRGNA